MYALLCCNDRRPSAAGRSCFHKIYHEHPEAVEPATAEAITLKPAASKPAELTLADVVPGQHAVVSSLLSGYWFDSRYTDKMYRAKSAR